MRLRKSREPFPLKTILHYLNKLAGKTGSGPVLGFILIIPWLSAAAYGCSGPYTEASEDIKESTIRLMNSAGDLACSIGKADFLIFNDDPLQRLDSYQSLATAGCGTVRLTSTSGPKIIAAIANSQRDRYGWAEVNSMESLVRLCSDLEKEQREQLLMSGATKITAGSPANIYMKRLCSEVIVRSLSCDFSGRPYVGASLEDVRIYLINVNAEASMMLMENHLPSRIINSGALNMDDVAGFYDRSMVLQEVEGSIGARARELNLSFLCYPNESQQESIGSPFTRLVVEGKVNGLTYFWSLDIAESGKGPGIRRNRQFVYDIRIRRLGHDRPDIPTVAEEVETIIEVKEWEEREEYGVRF